jgi:hypothetical protein
MPSGVGAYAVPSYGQTKKPSTSTTAKANRAKNPTVVDPSKWKGYEAG